MSAQIFHSRVLSRLHGVGGTPLNNLFYAAHLSGVRCLPTVDSGVRIDGMTEKWPLPERPRVESCLSLKRSCEWNG